MMQSLTRVSRLALFILFRNAPGRTPSSDLIAGSSRLELSALSNRFLRQDIFDAALDGVLHLFLPRLPHGT